MANEDQDPQAGGSYIRNADGTLTKSEELEAAIPAPAEQPAAPAAPTSKGAK